jgi:PmbA protein
VEKVLSLAKKVAQQAEVFQVFSQKTPVNFEANRLKQIQTKESSSIALRIIKDGRVGFAQASGVIEPQTLVDMALDTSKFGAEAKFELPGPMAYPQVHIYDPQVNETTIDTMVGFGENLITAIRQHTPDIQCEASVGKGSVSVHIINSAGGQASYKKTFFSVGIEGLIIRDDDMLFVGDSQSSCHPLLDVRELIEEVILQLELAKNKVGISARSMPVIFRPNGVASALVTPLITAFNGKIVLMGASPLKDKLGTRVFDQSFSVWDDATIPYQVASCPCDDEGVPGQRTSLVEQGTIAHFLYDLQTAGLANTRSTGNGGRNGGLPAPSGNSLVIGSGKVPFQDMVRDIKLGLVVEQLMGASQGNVLNGDFSGNVLLGFKIENGEITGRVKDTMVSGNIYTDLKQIVAIGQDSRWVGGSLQTPSIYCTNLAVASKEG